METIVLLDLDETLLFGIEHPLDNIDPRYLKELKTHFSFIEFSDDSFTIFFRPGLNEFLTSLEDNKYLVGIWTAATIGYALPIVEHIFTGRRQPYCFFTVSNCEFAQSVHRTNSLKPLAFARQLFHNKQSIVIVDDLKTTTDQFGGIKIQPFSLVNSSTPTKNSSDDQIKKHVESLARDNELQTCLTQIKNKLESMRGHQSS
jgi:hypothetical protein